MANVHSAKTPQMNHKVLDNVAGRREWKAGIADVWPTLEMR
jgi:hypothetical protein